MRTRTFLTLLALAGSLAHADWRNGLEAALNLNGGWTEDSLGTLLGNRIYLSGLNKGFKSDTNRFQDTGKAVTTRPDSGYALLSPHWLDQGILGNTDLSKPKARTLSIWFKARQRTGSNPTAMGILGMSDVRPEDGVWAKAWTPVLYIGGDGLLRARFLHDAHNRSQSDADMLNTTARVDDNRWHHAVLTVRDSVQELWLDGSKVESMATGKLKRLDLDSHQKWSTIGVTFLDYSQAGSGFYTDPRFVWFHGSLDDFRSWNRVLTDFEVRTLYAEESRTALPVAAPLRGQDDTVEIWEHQADVTKALTALNENGLPLTWTWLNPRDAGAGDPRITTAGVWTSGRARDYETFKGWIDTMLVTDGTQSDTVTLVVKIKNIDEPTLLSRTDTVYAVSPSAQIDIGFATLLFADRDSVVNNSDGSAHMLTGYRFLGDAAWNTSNSPIGLNVRNQLHPTMSLAGFDGRTVELRIVSQKYSPVLAKLVAIEETVRVAIGEQATTDIARRSTGKSFVAPTDGIVRQLSVDGRLLSSWPLVRGQSLELPQRTLAGMATRLLWIPSDGMPSSTLR